jgi:fumarate hydratase class II
MKENEKNLNSKFRIERDSFGELEIPLEALYGAQTMRALDNFPVSDLIIPRPFVRALAIIKGACAKANLDLKLLDLNIAKAIMDAADSVAAGQYDAHFPIDVFQTGSGTSTNMNSNEVIARIASLRSGLNIHPNDHVNMSQSSNDVIPTAIHISCSLEIQQHLLPALHHLATGIENRMKEFSHVIKTGRTHLMDALPLTLEQELSGWASQIRNGIHRVEATLPRIHALALGGTAVGTGVNAHPEFAKRVIVLLSERCALPFSPQTNYFEALSSQDSVVELSGQLKVLAVSLTKISNDLRLMNSGPLAGIAEIALPAIQPGSSIMPGKVNPVIPEAVCSACAQVIGNDLTITLGGLAGNFQLNTMLPVIAYNILQNLLLLSSSAKLLADKAIAGFTVNEEHIKSLLMKNPILVTALNPIIGYEKAAQIAKRAYQEKRSILEVANEMTDIPLEKLKELLDPRELTKGGIKS